MTTLSTLRNCVAIAATLTLAGASVQAAPVTSVTSPVTIVTPTQATRLETLAARETLRYLYLRTEHLVPIAPSIARDGSRMIVLAPKTSSLISQITRDPATRAVIAKLKPEQYLLKTVAGPHGAKTLLIAGGDDIGVLYGAYRLAEHLGVRFYLHGDTVPDARIPMALPKLNETGKPIFALRGIQPFHDFPEGPDWWSEDDYLTYVSQLAKMRMNFLGLHAYPEYSPNAEPLVWIGPPYEIDARGGVKAAYPASWYTMSRETWSYSAIRTSEFPGGAAALFARDDAGPEVMEGLKPFDQTPRQSALLFNRTGDLLHDVFKEAKSLGVKTCIGTETPLTIPTAVQGRLRAQGKNPQSLSVRRELYEGMFRRIAARTPVDYYWLWTPEGWTWGGNTPEQFAQTTDDIAAAQSALKALGKPFQLATCGWVLGPQNDRAALDKFLSKDIPMSAINRSTGNDPIDLAFGKIKDRPTWAIPWLENDPQLTAAQPWVGRMRYDAADAKRLGNVGLLGIHWRTKQMAQNVSALAAAAWDQSYVPANAFTPDKSQTEGAVGGRTASTSDPIANTNTPGVYQTVRYSTDGYAIKVPNGDYTVTLQFCETFYTESGKRVFGVQLQGKQVLEHLDLFARAGKNRALNLDYSDVSVKNGWINIGFTRETEYPSIAGIVISGRTAGGNQVPGAAYTRKIDCGGSGASGYEADIVGNSVNARGDSRTMPILDFYTDFARANFGAEAANEAGRIMASVDGMKMPKPVGWLDGPGNVAPDRTPWEKAKAPYAFVDRFAALRPKIQGAGNRERFDYWLNTYRMTEAMGYAGCLRGALDIAMDKIKAEPGAAQKKTLAMNALSTRIALARAWDKIIGLEVATVSTPGELGTIANLEAHTLRHAHFLDLHDAELAAALGASLPAAAAPSMDYRGAARIVVPTLRSQIAPGERLRLKVLLLGNTSCAAIYWRPLGQGTFQRIPLAHIARSVYTVSLPPASASAPALEYYVQANAGTHSVRFPVASQQNQTVVIAQL